jgi:biopolymer transport protein ExbD
MRRFSDRHSLHTLNELNITPLLDLAFVLLIIFMITTPLMEKSVDVVLPSSEAAKNAVNPEAVRTVMLHSDQRITLAEAEYDVPGLEAELTRLRESNPETAVVIRSHKDLPVQFLVTVMDAVQRARIAKVGVVTQPEEP